MVNLKANEFFAFNVAPEYTEVMTFQMKATRLILTVLVPASLFCVDPSPSRILILGDSLSDSGNAPQFDMMVGPDILTVDTGSPKTDGTTWPVWLGEALGMEWILPSSQDKGTNYAYVGALTDGNLPVPPAPSVTSIIPSLTAQLGQIPNDINTDYPAFMFGGANDFIEIGDFFTLSADQPLMSATNMSNIVDQMHDKGFKTLVILNLPNLGDVPALQLAGSDFVTNNPDIAVVEALGLEFNSLLADFMADKSFPVLGIDAEALLSDVIAFPDQYEFTNVTEGTPPVFVDLLGNIVPPPGSPTDGHLFYFDSLHPTHKAHRTLADYIFTTLASTSIYGQLSQLGFSVSREITANVRQQSYELQPCSHTCCFAPFISGSFAPLLTSPENPHIKNEESLGGNITAGFTYDFSCWRVGLAASFSRHDFEVKRDITKAEIDLYTYGGTFLIEAQGCYGYLSGTATVSYLDFFNIRRSFDTGFKRHRAKGDTNGLNVHGQLRGAFLNFCPIDHFSWGPVFDVSYQWASIDGYSESGARIGNLQYKKYCNDILASGLGLEMRYCYSTDCGCYPVDYFVTANLMGNRQWLSNSKNIKFRQISFGSNFGVWPTQIAKVNNFVSAYAGFAANICGCTTVTGGYNLYMGSLGMSEHVITLGVTVPI